MNIVTQLQQSSKGRENLWQSINQGIGIATCCAQFWVLDNVHITVTPLHYPARLVVKMSVWLSSTGSIWLPVYHSLSFESFVFVAFCNLGLRSFCFDVNRFLFSRREEDVGCDVLLQILLRFCPLRFLHLLHHLLLAHSSCCCKSDLPPVLEVWEEREKYLIWSMLLYGQGPKPSTHVHLK